SPSGADRHRNMRELTKLSATEFRRRFEQLVDSAKADVENVACVQCVACSGSTRCTFCRDSQGLLRCHYCVACVLRSACTQCRGSSHLSDCQHCQFADSCSSWAYVMPSTRLIGCTYCFGCVGLSGRDFFVLNQPCARDEYFALTRRLA